VVIVVIGLLAAITIVSYTGVSKKATEVSLQSDISNGLKQLNTASLTNGSFTEFGLFGVFWYIKPDLTARAYGKYLSSADTIGTTNTPKVSGVSVRCIKDQ